MAGGQPRGRTGTHRRPYSALNLRLLLASFGLVVCAVLAVLTARASMPVPAVALGLLAAVALVDLGVVVRRRRRRRHRGSLFE